MRTDTPSLSDCLWVLGAILAWALACGLLGGCGASVDAVAVPATAPATPTLPRPATVWVSFADGTPTPAADDGCGGVVQPAVSCDADCRGLILFELQQFFGDLAVSFVTAHPMGTDYLSLIFTGGTSEDCGTGGDYGGLAPLLCGAGGHGTGYVYTQQSGGMAATGAHEVGHLLGLVHVQGDDIMNPGVVGTSFGGGPVADHATCAGTTTQDDVALLVERVGYR
jgi:hypothetical protein